MRVVGARAELRSGFRVAATLARWTIVDATVMGDRPAEFAADVVTEDAFWSTQAPFTLWCHMGGDTWWVWQRVEVRRPSAMVAACRLYGSPEVRRV